MTSQCLTKWDIADIVCKFNLYKVLLFIWVQTRYVLLKHENNRYFAPAHYYDVIVPYQTRNSWYNVYIQCLQSITIYLSPNTTCFGQLLGESIFLTLVALYDVIEKNAQLLKKVTRA